MTPTRCGEFMKFKDVYVNKEKRFSSSNLYKFLRKRMKMSLLDIFLTLYRDGKVRHPKLFN